MWLLGISLAGARLGGASLDLASLLAQRPLARLPVETLTARQGLAHDAVRALLQDREGYLWIGTDDGLQRYDGVFFQSFPNSAVEGEGQLSHPRVQELLETPDGVLWIGTATGLDRLSADRTHLQAVRPRLGTDTVSINQLDLLPSGGVRAESEAGEAFTVSLGDDQQARLEPYPISDSPPFDEIFDGPRQRTPWIRVSRVQTGDFTWTGTAAGLQLQFAGGPPRKVILQGRGLTDEGLQQEVLSLLLDHSGTLWVGTYRGLHKADPARRPFVDYPQDGSLRGDAISSLLTVDPLQSVLLAGSFGGGLIELALASPRGVVRRHSISAASDGRCNDFVWSIQKIEHRVLVLSLTGACVFTNAGSDLALSHMLDGLECRAVERHPAGGLWVACRDRVLRLDDEMRVEQRWDVSAEALWVSPDGGVWFAPPAEESAEFLIELTTESSAPEIHALDTPAVNVFDLAGFDDRIFAATSGGLLAYDSTTGRTNVLAAAQVIGTAYSLIVESKNTVWLGSGRGVARVRVAEARAEGSARVDVRLFSFDEGLASPEHHRRSRLRLSDGRFLFGGSGGITAFPAAQIDSNPHVPATRIRHVTVEGDSGTRRANLHQAVLQPDDHAVTFEFTALNFTQAHRNQFRYRLSGIDPEWVDAGDRRSARYAGIAPGRYIFEVLGSNNDGLWSKEPALVNLLVRPPFFLTWWFRLLIALGLCALLAVAYQLRVRQLIALERMRVRIATDLHDDLGSELAGIALTSALVGSNESLSQTDRDRLRVMATTSYDVMEALRDIVWAVSPEHDIVDSLLDRMRAVARRLAPEMAIEFTVSPKASTRLDMVARRELLLSFKELLNNATRHGRATRLCVCLERSEDGLVLRVDDDGVGFGEAAVEGTGLASLRRRAHSLGGSFEVASSPGKGTRASLKVPVRGTSRRHRRRAERRPRK